MNNKKYYVGVRTDDGMMFVTEIDYKNRTSYWNKDSKPIAMSKSVAIMAKPTYPAPLNCPKSTS